MRLQLLLLCLVICSSFGHLSTRLRPHGCPIRTLLIDNYDSYTYNLWQLLSEVNGAEPTVIYNNAFNTDWKELMKTLSGDFDNIVLSPGPGNPTNPADFGLCMDAIKYAEVPLLGVCLGHQGLAHAFGGKIDKAPKPMHGRLSSIRHTNTGIFRGIEQDSQVVRYHSLLAYGISKCPELEETAWTIDPITGEKLLMGLQHRTRPLYGVQFHPESISTKCGRAMATNFRDLTLEARLSNSVQSAHSTESTRAHYFPVPIAAAETGAAHDSDETASTSSASIPRKTPPNLHIHVDRIKLPKNTDAAVTAEALFSCLYGDHPSAFWLDSAASPATSSDNSRKETGNDAPNPLLKQPARLSMMGAIDTSGSYVVEYAADNTLIKRIVTDTAASSTDKTQAPRPTLQSEQHRMNIFEFLQNHVTEHLSLIVHGGLAGTADGLPFDLSGSLFGYIGYEARHEADYIMRMSDTDRVVGSTGRLNGVDEGVNSPSATRRPYALAATHDGSFVGSQYTKTIPHPTALFMSPTRYLVIDHDERAVYTVSSRPQDTVDGYVHSERIATEEGLELSERVKRALESVGKHQDKPLHSPDAALSHGVPLIAHLPQPSLTGGPRWRTYRSAIDRCLSSISLGESYEVCLTAQFKGKMRPNQTSFDLYQTLRRHNPAPYACYLNYDPSRISVAPTSLSQHKNEQPEILHPCKDSEMFPSKGRLSICCSSPERFLKTSLDGSTLRLESKPIKGTLRRTLPATDERDDIDRQALQTDEKAQAENLMIVDLVRNDIGRVAKVGSVSVPGLMRVESFKTVHHMVSTIQASLHSDLTVVDALIATFPGGSMTGAPKLRTMEIIQDLEKRGRGVYSGTIGYIARSGVSDLNIAIRTAVVSGDNDLTISSGGAIIALSDPAEEEAEALLKAQAVSRAISYRLCDDSSSVSNPENSSDSNSNSDRGQHQSKRPSSSPSKVAFSTR